MIITFEGSSCIHQWLPAGLPASKCCVKMLLACALKHVAYLAIQKKENVVRHTQYLTVEVDLFLQVCENYPLSSRAFRNGNLKVRSYYEQKGTLRMRKSEKKVSRYIKRAKTSKDLLMKVVNFPALW